MPTRNQNADVSLYHQEVHHCFVRVDQRRKMSSKNLFFYFLLFKTVMKIALRDNSFSFLNTYHNIKSSGVHLKRLENVYQANKIIHRNIYLITSKRLISISVYIYIYYSKLYKLTKIKLIIFSIPEILCGICLCDGFCQEYF